MILVDFSLCSILLLEAEKSFLRSLGTVLQLCFQSFDYPSFRACLKGNMYIQPSDIFGVNVTLVFVELVFLPRATTCFDLACVALKFACHHFFMAR